MERPDKISKTLSTNDTGANGAHQAGILVPKDPVILSFFPPLDGETKNPRACIDLADEEGKSWRFTFIYYNNKLFGGTRNEYRLTGMTRFLREAGARPGDTLLFARDADDKYSVALERTSEAVAEEACQVEGTRVRLVVSSSWKVVRI
jgi:hypothetical protein